MPAPGVPALLSPASQPDTTALMTADQVSKLSLQANPAWGIYQNGEAAIISDSILSIEYKREYRIADYPQEAGAFQSYDKVQTPYDARVRMTRGGNTQDRANFLKALESMAGSMDLFDVVTPEATYINANVVRYDYHRTATNGVGLLTADIWLLEVRVSAAAAFTNTAAQSAAAPAFVGNVSPQAPTAAQAATIAPLRAAWYLPKSPATSEGWYLP